MRLLPFLAVILMLTGCTDKNNVSGDIQTVILYPGGYRAYTADSLKESSIAFFDDENRKKVKIHGHTVFFSDCIGKYELNNCIIKKYEPIKCISDGMYVAGSDIECGKYDILLNDGQDIGEITVYEDTGFHSFQDASFTETVTKSYEKDISLKNGQSISIYGVTLVKKDL